MNQVAEAFIAASSLVQANGYTHCNASTGISGSASLSSNPTAAYTGTSARLPGSATVAASLSAKYEAGVNIAGSSTFTTWVIFELSGTFIGAGAITDYPPPVRVLLVSGTLAGDGSLQVRYVPDVPMLGEASVSATAVVEHIARAAIKGGATVTAPAIVPRPTVAIKGGATVAANPVVRHPARVGIYPNSYLSASGATQTVDVVADSSFAASAKRSQRLIARVLGDSTVTGTATIPPAKIAAAVMGATSSVAAAPVVIPAGSQAALIVASSSVQAEATLNIGVHPAQADAPVNTLILGAQFTGAGTLGDKLLVTLEGLLSGAGAISGTAGLIMTARPLPLVGVGGMADSLPLPMIGAGLLSGFFEVQRLPKPVCPCPPRTIKTFRWGYTLTRGDLEIQICDDSGNPFGPVVVLYAFYQIVAGGQRMLIGPPNRRPAVDHREGKVGRYYATGTAGELGQPGSWVVVWRYQRSWWTETKYVEEPFKVNDEVTSGVPGSLYRRCGKYGWL